MPGPSPFADDWRDCLRAHYQHVIRTDDQVTESTLTGVLRDLNFSTTELAELRVLATMRDKGSGEFAASMDEVEAYIEAITPESAALIVGETLAAAQAHVEQVSETEALIMDKAEALAEDLPMPQHDDAPMQLSMF